MHLGLAESFEEKLAHEICTGGRAVVDSIEQLIVESLEDSVIETLGDRLIKAPRAAVSLGSYKNRFENISNLQKEGYSTWYPEVVFATGKFDDMDVSDIEFAGFEHGYIKFGGGIEGRFKYSKKELITQINHTVRLNKLTIPPELFSRVHLLTGEIAHPRIANLTVGFNNFVDDRIEGFRVVSFDHVITGSREFCECHRQAHTAMLSDAKARAPSYASYGWPHGVISLLDNAAYSDRLCHFCLIEAHGEEAASDSYGAQIQSHYGPYVDLLVHSADMDIRTATAEAQRRLSISRWKREDELYRIVSKLFPSHLVRREASPSWLGQQRIDIYLPELKLVIEHQGEQHYRPVGAFGGEEAFAKTLERDERKRALCKKNGVAVVDIRFDAPLTLPAIRSRLRRWKDVSK